MSWILGSLLAVACSLAIALLIAIRINGAAVLDRVDRIAGGSREVALLEQARFGQGGRQVLDVYATAAATSEPKPVLLFLHGGGWNNGNPADYGFIGRAFAPEGFVVVTAGYRLHPEGVFPAMLEDTARAIGWTRANIARLGGDPNRIVLAGHSAGAYNVVMSVLDRQWLAREGLGPDAIAGVIGLAGPYDFFPFTSDSARNAFGHVPDGETTQPIRFVHPGAPPMLLLHGDKDTVVRPRNSHALAAELDAAGTSATTRIYPGMDHTDVLVSLASPWRSKRPVLKDMVEFARTVRASVPVQDKIG
ncbi:MAG TPA: alpha/beta hydrolase [Erythrobacter sp.]|nr:alpha/beta hydrolase [Erythrobacter sp.]